MHGYFSGDLLSTIYHVGSFFSQGASFVVSVAKFRAGQKLDAGVFH